MADSMEDMRQQAAASALAKQQQERWEKSLSSEPLRGAKNLAGDVGSALLGDFTRFDTDSSREAMSAVPISDTNPGISGSGVMGTIGSDPQANAKTAGQKRERSLQAQTLDDQAREAQLSQRDAAVRGVGALELADQADEQQFDSNEELRDLRGDTWADQQEAYKNYKNHMRHPQPNSRHRPNAMDEWRKEGQRLRQVAMALGQDRPAPARSVGGLEAASQAYGVERDSQDALSAREFGRVAALEREASGAVAAEARARPHQEFSPGEGDISELRRLWEESARAEDVWKSTEKGPQADALREAAHKAANEFQAKAKALGVSDYLGDALDVESARGWEEMVRENAEIAFRDQDREDMGVAEADIQRARQQEREALGRIQGHESEIRRGVTAGIEPGPSVGERVANTVGGVAAATVAPAAGQYARTQDTYEQLRHLSLQMARGPLTLQHLNNTQTLGMLLRDRGLADRLYSEGLIDQEVQERLTAKRAQHGY